MKESGEFDQNKKSLQELLKKQSILYSNDRKLTDRKGNALSWVYYDWATSLTHEGINLIFKCLAKTLQEFTSTQIASFGMTSVPMMTACVTLGNGKYSGLAIRTHREDHGTRNQIEGKGDTSRPVILVDDCISSGNSILKAISVLEAEGYIVEGVIVVVYIPFRGGLEKLVGNGYKLRYLFDVRKDLGIIANPFLHYNENVHFTLDDEYKLEDGLTPAQVVRKAITCYLEKNTFPSPPESFDKKYDASGGIFISLRDKKNGFRVARDGFFIIDAKKSNPTRDLICATNKLLFRSLRKIEAHGFDSLKIGVTFLSQNRVSRISELNFKEAGILIQSQALPAKIGGALPNTHETNSVIQQLTQASKNATIGNFEPVTIYTHHVVKDIEPGYHWPNYGYSLFENEKLNDVNNDFKVNLIADYVTQILKALIDKRTPPEINNNLNNNFQAVSGIGITLYSNKLVGCWTSFLNPIGKAIAAATIKAWEDKRFDGKDLLAINDVSFTISLFYNRVVLGKREVSKMGSSIRIGTDTLVAKAEKKYGIMIAYFASHNGWSGQTMALKTKDKAGIKQDDAEWEKYQTASWLVSDRFGLLELKAGFPLKKINKIDKEWYQIKIRSLATYLKNQVNVNNFPDYSYMPNTDKSTEQGSLTRIILALNALLEAGLFLNDTSFKEQAVLGLNYFVSRIDKTGNDSHLAIPQIVTKDILYSHLLLAVSKEKIIANFNHDQVQMLFQKVVKFCHKDGAISGSNLGRRIAEDQDYFPAVTLLSISEYLRCTNNNISIIDFEPHFEWYKRRFQLLKPWGLIWWQMQAWSSIYKITGKNNHADFVFMLADYAIENQLSDGSFLIDYCQIGSNFLSACVLEGINDALFLSIDNGNNLLSKKYADSAERTLSFLHQLIINETDTYFMPNPQKAIGGVRESLTSSFMRIDYTAHVLLALIKGAKIIS